MTAKTKMKITYGEGEETAGSKTISNMNPEATNDNLVNTANKLASLQNKTIMTVERIDTTTISG